MTSPLRGHNADPKTICILTEPRTGSTWLCEALDNELTLCAYELFNTVVEELHVTLSHVFAQLVPDTILQVFKSRYSMVGIPVPLVRLMDAPENLPKLGVDYLEAFQRVAYEHGKWFVFKFMGFNFAHVSPNDFALIVEKSDYFIINYRQNVLETYISHKKSEVTDCWSAESAERNRIDKNRLQLTWDEADYRHYYDTYVSHFRRFASASAGRARIVLSYEELHHDCGNDEKLRRLERRLRELGVGLKLARTRTRKEGEYSDFEVHFANVDEFRCSVQDRRIPVLFRPKFGRAR